MTSENIDSLLTSIWPSPSINICFKHPDRPVSRYLHRFALGTWRKTKFKRSDMKRGTVLDFICLVWTLKRKSFQFQEKKFPYMNSGRVNCSSISIVIDSGRDSGKEREREMWEENDEWWKGMDWGSKQLKKRGQNFLNGVDKDKIIKRSLVIL